MISITAKSLTLFSLLAIPGTLITENQAIIKPDRAEHDQSFMTNSNSWMMELMKNNKKGVNNGE